MKKHILGLAMIIALASGILSGQAFASSASSSVYTVKPGDTLWEIARNNNVTVEDLLTWNELDSSLIIPLQTLIIEENRKVYIIQKGDTLFDIAENHNITLEDLMKLNRISGHLIYPGDQLTLSKAKSSSSKANKESPAPNVKTKAPAPAPPIKKEEAKTEAQAPTTPATKAPAASSQSQKEMTVTATAYTAYCQGCSGITYTGIDLRSNPNQKVIAVDPSVIPLGTRVWVEGYGEAVAGDIGGAIKGNIIDVFLENKQDALNWGRKTVTIKILD